MKAIMISIKPKRVAKILNGEKTIEIRKKFPKDYIGWVYIYCTKGDKNTCLEYADNPDKNKEGKWCVTSGYPYANGKVVARFWCNKVEEIKFINPNRTCGFSCEISDDDCYYNINENECCLSQDDLYDYLQGKNGKAIYITKLEIFDKPKEISEFYRIIKTDIRYCIADIEKQKPITLDACKKITKAPQSWCYIEV